MLYHLLQLVFAIELRKTFSADFCYVASTYEGPLSWPELSAWCVQASFMMLYKDAEDSFTHTILVVLVL
jgi:hypothetical protein